MSTQGQYGRWMVKRLKEARVERGWIINTPVKMTKKAPRRPARLYCQSHQVSAELDTNDPEAPHRTHYRTCPKCLAEAMAYQDSLRKEFDQAQLDMGEPKRRARVAQRFTPTPIDEPYCPREYRIPAMSGRRRS